MNVLSSIISKLKTSNGINPAASMVNAPTMAERIKNKAVEAATMARIESEQADKEQYNVQSAIDNALKLVNKITHYTDLATKQKIEPTTDSTTDSTIINYSNDVFVYAEYFDKKLQEVIYYMTYINKILNSINTYSDTFMKYSKKEELDKYVDMVNNAKTLGERSFNVASESVKTFADKAIKSVLPIVLNVGNNTSCYANNAVEAATDLIYKNAVKEAKSYMEKTKVGLRIITKLDDLASTTNSNKALSDAKLSIAIAEKALLRAIAKEALLRANPTITEGSSKDIYMNKYLKYKNKYVLLKTNSI